MNGGERWKNDGKIRETPLTETMIVPDIFVSGLASVEDIGGGCLRLTFYVNQKPVHDPNADTERVVAARLVMPAEAARALQTAVNGSKRKKLH